MTIEVTDATFQEETKDGIVLVDFWATWCGPCKMLAPTVSEIADEYEGKVKVCKLDVDQAMDIAMSYGVASIPTLILFKDGEIVKKSVGVVSKTEIEALWSQNNPNTDFKSYFLSFDDGTKQTIYDLFCTIFA